jgi:serine/threonine-protein kinase RsbT
MKDALIAGEVRVPIGSDTDIVAVRQNGRDVASQCGFLSTDVAVVATAISELARNIVCYAARGEIVLRLVDDSGKRGVEVLAADAGPGIADVTLAMQEGFSTSGGLGLGLPGVRRIMDEFEIISVLGRGTTVTARKWIGVNSEPPELDDWLARFGRAWARGIATGARPTPPSNLEPAQVLGLIVALAGGLSGREPDVARDPAPPHRVPSLPRG